MPGLLRGMARTAVVAGTATAVSNRVSRRQAERWYGQDPYQQQQQYAEPAPAAPAPAGGESRVQKLKDLADLKQQGVLNEEEFEAEKARILAS
jgi:putative oligomerization/nucleic acid binding protein